MIPYIQTHPCTQIHTHIHTHRPIDKYKHIHNIQTYTSHTQTHKYSQTWYMHIPIPYTHLYTYAYAYIHTNTQPYTKNRYTCRYAQGSYMKLWAWYYSAYADYSTADIQFTFYINIPNDQIIYLEIHIFLKYFKILMWEISVYGQQYLSGTSPSLPFPTPQADRAHMALLCPSSPHRQAWHLASLIRQLLILITGQDNMLSQLCLIQCPENEARPWFPSPCDQETLWTLSSCWPENDLRKWSFWRFLSLSLTIMCICLCCVHATHVGEPQ